MSGEFSMTPDELVDAINEQLAQNQDRNPKNNLPEEVFLSLGKVVTDPEEK